MYQEEILKICDQDDIDKNKIVFCILLTKPNPIPQEKYIKDGFHLHFPYFICLPYITEYVRDKVINEIISKNIFGDCTFITDIKTIVDCDISKKCWLVYSSSKKRNGSIYTRNSVYNYLGVKTPYPYCISNDINLYKLLSIRNKKPINKLTSDIIEFELESRCIKRKTVIYDRSEESIIDDLKIIEEGKILDMLSDERADDYNQWMIIGWILWNITNGDMRGFDLWDMFSSRSDKYDWSKNEVIWNRMTKGNYTISTLLYYANIDSPEKYMKWRSKTIRYMIYESIEMGATQYCIANIMYCIFKNKYKCVSAKNEGEWYEFKNHKWYNDNNCETRNIMQLIPTVLYTEYMEVYKYLEKKKKRYIELNDDSDHMCNKIRSITMKLQKINSVTMKMQNIAFISSIVKMCKLTPFYDSTFLKVKDNDNKLFCCKNGVLDLNNLCFRPGSPEDNITMSSNVSYNENPSSWELKMIDSFLDKVFPDKELKTYFIDLISSKLEGGNINKKFIIAIGDGNNSKSFTFNILLKEVFGDYLLVYKKHNILTGVKRTHGTADEELLRMENVRIAITNEVTGGDKIEAGLIKEITGGDIMTTRGLYKSCSDIRPSFMLIILGNSLPDIPHHDKAMWNRLRVLNFESKFDDEAPKSRKDQINQKHFTIDNRIHGKVNILATSLLYVLFANYKKIKYSGYKEPSKVITATALYESKSNYYRNFIRDKLHKTNDSSIISVRELYQIFNVWFQDTYPVFRSDKPGQDQFRTEIQKYNVKIENGKCIGYILKIDDEEIYEK